MLPQARSGAVSVDRFDDMADQQMLFVIGLNYKTAPIEVREKLYISESEVPELIKKFREVVSECIILSTCNRTEIYGVCDADEFDAELYKSIVIDFKGAGDAVTPDHFFTYVSCAACRQIFDVATSLDSKVVGDSQILRQLRKAYVLAQQHHSTGKILNQLSQRALKIGKRTYTETLLHKGAASVSSAAVEVACQWFGSLRNRTALVIGAGETARLTTEALIKKHAGRIIVTNRTRKHAEDMLEELRQSHSFEGEVADFSEFREFLPEIDIVISSTGSPDPILDEAEFALHERKLLLIDIAIPRDIEPSERSNPNVQLRNIDDLYAILDDNYEKRMSDLPKVKKLIVQEMSDFLMWYYSLSVMPSISTRGCKPGRETVDEILGVKNLLLQNLSHIHKLAMQPQQSIQDDVKNHIALIERLRAMKAGTPEVSNAGQ